MQPQTPYSFPAGVPAPKRKVNLALVFAIIFGIFTVGLSGLSVYLWLEYTEQKENVDGISAQRAAEAVKVQSEKLEADFLEREKEPLRQFAGPEDLGRLTFMYPKTWSLHVGQGLNPYRAILHPLFIDANNSRYAVRVTIEERSYETVIASYKDRVAKKGLKSTAVEIGANDNKVLGTRFDGPLTDQIVGSAVVFKIRDKTVTVQTDIETARPDFNKLVQSIIFNK